MIIIIIGIRKKRKVQNECKILNFLLEFILHESKYVPSSMECIIEHVENLTLN